jgi:hypothetical protein
MRGSTAVRWTALTDNGLFVSMGSTSVLKQNGHEASRRLHHETNATYANGDIDLKLRGIREE